MEDLAVQSDKRGYCVVLFFRMGSGGGGGDVVI